MVRSSLLRYDQLLPVVAAFKGAVIGTCISACMRNYTLRLMGSRRGFEFCALWFYGFNELRARRDVRRVGVAHIRPRRLRAISRGYSLTTKCHYPLQGYPLSQEPPPRQHDQRTSLPQRRMFGAANAVDARTASLPRISYSRGRGLAAALAQPAWPGPLQVVATLTGYRWWPHSIMLVPAF